MQITTHSELEPFLARLATSMDLDGPDAKTFIAQPFRKIERYIEPPVTRRAPGKINRRWLDWICRG